MTTDAIFNTIKDLWFLASLFGGGWALFLFYERQKLQKAANYRELEFKAIDLFLEAARRTDVNLNRIYLHNISLPKGEPTPAGLPDWDPQDRPLFDYTFSILNLFEVMYNMQKRKLVTEEIFLTWVAWYWDFAKGQFPKWLWEEGKWNYSSEFIEMMNEFMSRGSTKEDKKSAYRFLDKKGMIRYPLDKYFASHSM